MSERTRDEMLREFGADELARLLPPVVAERVNALADRILALESDLADARREKDAMKAMAGVAEAGEGLLAVATEMRRLHERAAAAERERDEAREELERERLRLAACGVAARGESRSVSTIYTSDSLKAVVDLRYRAERAERERDEARRENARLREDAERLDHMAKNCYALSCITDNDGIPRYRASVLFPWVTDFREAIDTARAQARTKEQPE